MEQLIVKKDGQPWFSVETAPAAGPLRSTLTDSLTVAADSVAVVGDAIAKVSADVISAIETNLGDAMPNDVKLKFGVTIGAEASIPLVSKASGDATFEVTVRWKPKRGKK